MNPNARIARAAALAARCVLVPSLLVTSLALTASPASASRSGSDRVGGAPLSAGRVRAAQAPDVAARSGVLVDDSGRVLWARAATSQRAMASTTKVMTALIVLENADLNETVRVPRRAASVGYATGLKAGEHRTVGKLLELALIASSNDAATALAIHVGGSERGFAALMNARARELGMDDTHYSNPHGLDARGHYSSAADIAVLMREAMKHPEFRRIVAMRTVWLPGYRGRAGRVLKSTDKLLGRTAGLHGGKTGYTGRARFAFVGSAGSNGTGLTAVVLGAPSSAARFASADRLIRWGRRHYHHRPLVSAGDRLGSVPAAQNGSVLIPVRAGSAASGMVLDVAGKVTLSPSLPTAVPLPVYAGQPLGQVRVMQGGSVLATVPAVAATSQASAEETVGAASIAGYARATVALQAATTDTPVKTYDPKKPLTRTLDVPTRLRAPLAAGTPVGVIRYTQDGSVVAVVPVVTSRSVPSPTAWDRLAAVLVNGLPGS